MIPPDPELERLLMAARQAYAGGNRIGAKQFAQHALLRRPGDPGALQILGLIALDAGEFASARRHLEAVAKARPDASTFNMLGVAARGAGDIDAARAAFTRAGELGLIDGWRNLAIASAGDTEAVIHAHQRALAMSPADAAANAGLAQAFESRHDLARARRHAEAALKSDPVSAIARLALARVLMREKDFAGAEATVAPIAQSAASIEQRILTLGLLGDARDRRDDADGAFAAFTAANQLSLQVHSAWLNATDRLYHPQSLRRIASLLTAAAPEAASQPATPAPAFLVGFPRSGTTLLDQILSSHSGIVCLEEREFFSDALNEVLTQDRVWDFESLTAEEVSSIRASYWRRVHAEHSASESALFVDKFPLNIVVLPWIKAVFPDAKIILALRDPRDVVLSCYQQRFGMNAAMAQFLQLGTAAAYYDQVMSLYGICEERLALDAHRVRYEDVVANLEAEARGLCAFLGVAHEPAMLNFRATALSRSIATPSARQVIEPLYNRSVGRWRRYAAHLAPVLPGLTNWAERLGYHA